MNSENRPVTLVTRTEQDQISRMLLAWINGYPDKPVRVINYEFLPDGAPSMALSTIQAAYRVRQYITGGYLAQYQFKVIYRVQPTTNNDRLKADELLDGLGDWVSTNPDKPALGAGIRCKKIETTARSSFFARYENGDEDHQILLNMTYEVI